MKQFFKYMLATMCGLLLFFFVGIFSLVFSLIGMVASSSGTATTLESHSIYHIEMKGVVDERVEDNPFGGAMAEAMGQAYTQQIGLDDLLRNIRIAKEDKHIDAIYLEGGNLSMGFATATALRDALLDFRESGKPVIAYAQSYGQINYYLASAADSIYLNATSGSISWHGLASQLSFYSRLLEKIGVEMQVVKVGTFKSAVEPYILTGMSEPNRLQYDMLLGDMWDQVKAGVAAGRGVTVEQLQQWADENLMFAEETDYMHYGLVDALCYPQEMDSVLAAVTGTKDYHLVKHADMCSVEEKTSRSSEEVAVLYAFGEITDEYGDGIVGTKLIEEIDKLRKNEDVKAVVLRVNSPGGSASASEQIHHALTLLKAEKPLVVSMGDYAASGGYYISSPAHYIYAEPTTLTGSIGIFGLIPCYGKLADRVGVDFDGVKTARLADLEMNAVTKGMNTEERALMQGMINRGYELFTRRCAEGRGMSQDSIKAIAEGRVWSGTRALQIGLVDSLGHIEAAIAKAAELAQMDKYKVVSYPEKEDFMTRLMKEMNASAAIDRIVARRIGETNYRTLRYIEEISSKPTIQARQEVLIMAD